MAPCSRSSLQQNSVLRLPWTEGTISFLGWILQLFPWFRDPVPSRPILSHPTSPHPPSYPMVEQRAHSLAPQAGVFEVLIPGPNNAKEEEVEDIFFLASRD